MRSKVIKPEAASNKSVFELFDKTGQQICEFSVGEEEEGEEVGGMSW